MYSEVEEVEDELDAALAEKTKAERDRDAALAEVDRLTAVAGGRGKPETRGAGGAKRTGGKAWGAEP